jgi:hypothetical protein
MQIRIRSNRATTKTQHLKYLTRTGLMLTRTQCGTGDSFNNIKIAFPLTRTKVRCLSVNIPNSPPTGLHQPLLGREHSPGKQEAYQLGTEEHKIQLHPSDVYKIW